MLPEDYQRSIEKFETESEAEAVVRMKAAADAANLVGLRVECPNCQTNYQVKQLREDATFTVDPPENSLQAIGVIISNLSLKSIVSSLLKSYETETAATVTGFIPLSRSGDPEIECLDCGETTLVKNCVLDGVPGRNRSDLPSQDELGLHRVRDLPEL